MTAPRIPHPRTADGPHAAREDENMNETKNVAEAAKVGALHSVTIECEPTDYWPTLKFTCHAPHDSPCRTICPNPECEEGCYHPGQVGHEREPVNYCNNVEWLENSDEVAGDIFGGPTSITVPIDVSWERGEEGPLWRFTSYTSAPRPVAAEQTTPGTGGIS